MLILGIFIALSSGVISILPSKKSWRFTTEGIGLTVFLVGVGVSFAAITLDTELGGAPEVQVEAGALELQVGEVAFLGDNFFFTRNDSGTLIQHDMKKFAKTKVVEVPADQTPRYEVMGKYTSEWITGFGQEYNDEPHHITAYIFYIPAASDK